MCLLWLEKQGNVEGGSGAPLLIVPTLLRKQQCLAEKKHFPSTETRPDSCGAGKHIYDNLEVERGEGLHFKGVRGKRFFEALLVKKKLRNPKNQLPNEIGPVPPGFQLRPRVPILLAHPHLGHLSPTLRMVQQHQRVSQDGFLMVAW